MDRDQAKKAWLSVLIYMLRSIAVIFIGWMLCIAIFSSGYHLAGFGMIALTIGIVIWDGRRVAKRLRTLR